MVYTKTSAVACFNEAIPVMQYLCSRLEEIKSYWTYAQFLINILIKQFFIVDYQNQMT